MAFACRQRSGAIMPVASERLESRETRASHLIIEHKTVGTGLEAVEVRDDVSLEMGELSSEFSSMLTLSSSNLAKPSRLICADFTL